MNKKGNFCFKCFIVFDQSLFVSGLQFYPPFSFLLINLAIRFQECLVNVYIYRRQKQIYSEFQYET